MDVISVSSKWAFRNDSGTPHAIPPTSRPASGARTSTGAGADGLQQKQGEDFYLREIERFRQLSDQLEERRAAFPNAERAHRES